MVAEPYVNHAPTMTGGVGHNQLKRFYKRHFIGGNPPDTELAPISRTVGADQLVDEMLFKITHTSEIDIGDRKSLLICVPFERLPSPAAAI